MLGEYCLSFYLLIDLIVYSWLNECCSNVESKIPRNVARIPYCCKNALIMLQKCCNLTVHIIVTIIIIIIIIIIIVINVILIFVLLPLLFLLLLSPLPLSLFEIQHVIHDSISIDISFLCRFKQKIELHKHLSLSFMPQTEHLPMKYANQKFIVTPLIWTNSMYCSI